MPIKGRRFFVLICTGIMVHSSIKRATDPIPTSTLLSMTVWLRLRWSLEQKLFEPFCEISITGVTSLDRFCDRGAIKGREGNYLELVARSTRRVPMKALGVLGRCRTTLTKGWSLISCCFVGSWYIQNTCPQYSKCCWNDRIMNSVHSDSWILNTAVTSLRNPHKK